MTDGRNQTARALGPWKEVPNEVTIMYKIISKEDTIRIPAEYMRRGQSLNQHIDRLAASAFEGRFDEENRFILATANHLPLGRGRIIHGDGAVYQHVRFDALLFCMEDYEVVGKPHHHRG